ncbi:MAG: type VI secretion system tube protein Hcp [Anaerolineae bacterium]|nr:type VI secretion system tube protein Hcp [Anaerolineae bacterium]
MSYTVNLFLKANGVEIQGESTQASLGRENSIECLSYADSVHSTVVTTAGRARGRAQYDPIVFRKRIDKSTPLLFRALCNNEVIEGVFRFFRPNPTGDGTTEQFFTVEIAQGRIASIRRTSPDTLDPAAATHPAEEEVSITFQAITVRYENGGVEHQDRLRATR